jgi:hypothetical protein
MADGLNTALTEMLLSGIELESKVYVSEETAIAKREGHMRRPLKVGYLSSDISIKGHPVTKKLRAIFRTRCRDTSGRTKGGQVPQARTKAWLYMIYASDQVVAEHDDKFVKDKMGLTEQQTAEDWLGEPCPNNYLLGVRRHPISDEKRRTHIRHMRQVAEDEKRCTLDPDKPQTEDQLGSFRPDKAAKQKKEEVGGDDKLLRELAHNDGETIFMEARFLAAEWLTIDGVDVLVDVDGHTGTAVGPTASTSLASMYKAFMFGMWPRRKKLAGFGLHTSYGSINGHIIGDRTSVPAELVPHGIGTALPRFERSYNPKKLRRWEHGDSDDEDEDDDEEDENADENQPGQGGGMLTGASREKIIYLPKGFSAFVDARNQHGDAAADPHVEGEQARARQWEESGGGARECSEGGMRDREWRRDRAWLGSLLRSHNPHPPKTGQKVDATDDGASQLGSKSPFLYCSFSQLHKITPSTVDVWASLLRRVPTTALWLLEYPSNPALAAKAANESSAARMSSPAPSPYKSASWSGSKTKEASPAIARLVAEFAVRGIDWNRLVFSPLLPEDEDWGEEEDGQRARRARRMGTHMRLKRLCGLHLDTTP